MSERKIIIDRVIPGSIADELGIDPGDALLSVNGDVPEDLLDYRFLIAGDEIEIEVLKQNDEIWTCDVEKEYDEDLGMGFAQDTFDGIRSCANKCVFCFVDQMPADMRESLYVKDDDYRLSFLHGNFVTLSNLTSRDMNRILQMRISPLYVSVHCTNPVLREELLGNKRSGEIMDQLKALAGAGIDMHTQIVLCPGLNDGDELTRSIDDLSSLWPQVRSIAIVPVGLTKYRDNLHDIRRFTPDEAEQLIDRIRGKQKEFIKEYGSPLVYLGDEFYVLARRKFPESRFYGDYPQLENGVGLVRLFYESFEKAENKLPPAFDKKKNVALATGTSGEYVLKPVVDRLNRIENLRVETVGIKNSFFGGHVSVAGLLTGIDVLRALKEKPLFDLVLLPSVMCKRDEPVFLDGMTPSELQKGLNTPVKVIEIDDGAQQLIEVITELAKSQ